MATATDISANICWTVPCTVC